MCEAEEEASFDNFFHSGKASFSVVIVSLHAASESDQSDGDGGGTADDPVGTVMLITIPSVDIP